MNLEPKLIDRYNEAIRLLKTANDFKISTDIKVGSIIMDLTQGKRPELLGVVTKISTNKTLVTYNRLNSPTHYKTDKSVIAGDKRISTNEKNIVVLENTKYVPHLWFVFVIGGMIADNMIKEMFISFSSSINVGLILNPFDILQSYLTEVNKE